MLALGPRRAPLDKELDACKAAAGNLLSFRPHARAELAAKLTDKGFDRETVEAALARVAELVRAGPGRCSSPCCTVLRCRSARGLRPILRAGA